MMGKEKQGQVEGEGIMMESKNESVKGVEVSISKHKGAISY